MEDFVKQNTPDFYLKATRSHCRMLAVEDQIFTQVVCYDKQTSDVNDMNPKGDHGNRDGGPK